jgi:hypothetical protein
MTYLISGENANQGRCNACSARHVWPIDRHLPSVTSGDLFCPFHPEVAIQRTIYSYKGDSILWTAGFGRGEPERIPLRRPIKVSFKDL